MNEVSPRPSDNEVCSRRFDIRVTIADGDVVIGCVKGGIVTYNQVATGVDVDSAVVLRRHVAVDPTSSACNMHSSSVIRARTITLTGVTFYAAQIIHLDPIVRVPRSGRSSHSTAGGGKNSIARVAARVTVTDGAGGARNNPASPVLLRSATGNECSLRTGDAS